MIRLISTTLGEWIETNIISMVVAIVGWLATVGGIIWKLSQIASSSKSNGDKVEALAKQFAEHSEDFREHENDMSVHTTFEFRQSVSSRLDRIEDTVKNGHTAIEAKIDRWAERILNK